MLIVINSLSLYTLNLVILLILKQTPFFKKRTIKCQIAVIKEQIIKDKKQKAIIIFPPSLNFMKFEKKWKRKRYTAKCLL